MQRRISDLEHQERAETQGDTTDNAQEWENAEIRSGEMDPAVDELRDVESALQRLDQGTYGVCESCGKPIGDKRLDGLPDAVLCVACAEEADSAGGG